MPKSVDRDFQPSVKPESNPRLAGREIGGGTIGQSWTCIGCKIQEPFDATSICIEPSFRVVMTYLRCRGSAITIAPLQRSAYQLLVS
jgi:hypothetical protein